MLAVVLIVNVEWSVWVPPVPVTEVGLKLCDSPVGGVPDQANENVTVLLVTLPLKPTAISYVTVAAVLYVAVPVCDPTVRLWKFESVK